MKLTKTSRYLIGTAMAIGVLLAYVFDQPSWSCSAKLGASDAGYGRVGRSWRRTTMSTDGTLFSGMVVNSPLKFIVELRGNGSYTFDYSPNITSIRLSIGHQLVYAGPPIEQITGRGIVTIEPESTGDEVWVEVKDKCSPGSILRGLFRNAVDAMKSN